MWSSSFADFAKKAQDAAASNLSSININNTNIFNLDSMLANNYSDENNDTSLNSDEDAIQFSNENINAPSGFYSDNDNNLDKSTTPMQYQSSEQHETTVEHDENNHDRNGHVDIVDRNDSSSGEKQNSNEVIGESESNDDDAWDFEDEDHEEVLSKASNEIETADNQVLEASLHINPSNFYGDDNTKVVDIDLKPDSHGYSDVPITLYTEEETVDDVPTSSPSNPHHSNVRLDDEENNQQYSLQDNNDMEIYSSDEQLQKHNDLVNDKSDTTNSTEDNISSPDTPAMNVIDQSSLMPNTDHILVENNVTDELLEDKSIVDLKNDFFHHNNNDGLHQQGTDSNSSNHIDDDMGSQPLAEEDVNVEILSPNQVIDIKMDNETTCDEELSLTSTNQDHSQGVLDLMTHKTMDDNSKIPINQSTEAIENSPIIYEEVNDETISIDETNVTTTVNNGENDIHQNDTAFQNNDDVLIDNNTIESRTDVINIEPEIIEEVTSNNEMNTIEIIEESQNNITEDEYGGQGTEGDDHPENSQIFPNSHNETSGYDDNVMQPISNEKSVTDNQNEFVDHPEETIENNNPTTELILIDGESLVSEAGMYESDDDMLSYEGTDKSKTDMSSTNEQAAAIPQFALEKFMLQLERLHTQHEAELQEMEKKHNNTVREWENKLRDVHDSRKTIASHDKCLAQLRALEKDFNKQLEDKDKEYTKTIEEKKSVEKQLKESTRNIEVLTIALKERGDLLAKVDEKEEEIKTLRTSLTAAKEELKTSNETYSQLKERVKGVATELKDRRAECRTLHVNISDLTLQKSSLEKEKADLQMTCSRLENENDEKYERITHLESQLSGLQEQLQSTENALIEKGSLGDKALTAYKKKAQASLANANARAAASNQAREDAEIEASNARSEAQAALEIARKATDEKEAALAKATEDLQEFLDEIERLKTNLSDANNEHEVSKSRCMTLAKDIDELKLANEGLLEELKQKESELSKERQKSTNLTSDLALVQIKKKALKDEVELLHEELEKSTSAAFMAKQDSKQSNKSNASMNFSDQSSTDATVIQLQQELNDANYAITELKDTIRNLISSQQNELTTNDIGENALYSLHKNNVQNTWNVESSTNNGMETPLFFVLEKQAELNTAREEISRLASILSDAESAKIDALESMEQMRKKMEEAESRLRRYEKLGPATTSRQGGSSSLLGGHGHTHRYGHWQQNQTSGTTVHNANNMRGKSMQGYDGGEASLSSPNDSTVNLEYLKNIVLRYLNAKTLNEKKTLVPVIGAILELTADEESQAMNNLEKSSGIQGVGTSLIENMQSKGLLGGLLG